MTKQARKAAVRAFRAALIQHDTATRLDALEARVRELEDFPAQFAKALRKGLRHETGAPQ
jgi:hypothetical protein